MTAENRTQKKPGSQRDGANASPYDALYGALSAFARSSSRSPSRVAAPSESGAANGSALRSRPARTRPPPPPSSSKPVLKELQPLSKQEEHTKTTAQTGTGQKSRQIQGDTRSVEGQPIRKPSLSPSANIAASQAAARYMQHNDRSLSASRSPLPAPRSNDHIPESADGPEDVLPSPGTVTGMKSWLETLTVEAPQSKGQKTTTTESPQLDLQERSATSTPKQSAGRQGLNRPRLEIPAVAQSTDDIVKAQGSPPEIHSPKPMRRDIRFESLEVSDGTTIRTTADSASLTGAPPLSQQKSTVSTGGPLSPSTIRTESDRRPSTVSNVSIPSVISTTSTATTRTEPTHQGSFDSVTRRSSETPTTKSAGGALQHDDMRRVDSLANAIVASHLASAKAPAAAAKSAMPPPPLPRRQADKNHQFLPPISGGSPVSRTPSPGKAMRQTLRKPPSSDEDDDKPSQRSRGHFHIRKHPHKHHEGDRKRWRDEITPQERKRYEGVWAANKDLYVTYTAEDATSNAAMERAKNTVSGLVAKDIWSRSRLPGMVLEEIWELVDMSKAGRLKREEFVVGLWLIDQRLKGRKVPPRVSDSVWRSARGITGLKIPKIKR